MQASPRWATCLLVVGLSGACSSDAKTPLATGASGQGSTRSSLASEDGDNGDEDPSRPSDTEFYASTTDWSTTSPGLGESPGSEENGTDNSTGSDDDTGHDNNDDGDSTDDTGHTPGDTGDTGDDGDNGDNGDTGDGTDPSGQGGGANASATPSKPGASVSDEPPEENPGNAPKICAPGSLYPASPDRCKEYVPQFPLWSDGLKKDRYIFLPAGDIDTSDPNRWTFPKGTRFYKNFSDTKGNLLETRVITKFDGGIGYNAWDFKVYVWSDNQKDPALAIHTREKGKDGKIVGLDKSASYKAVRATDHGIPSLKECSQCHKMDGKDAVLGFAAIQLDWGAAQYSLAQLKSDQRVPQELSGSLSNVPEGSPREAVGYLHGNCGNCHAPGGYADLFTAFQLFADVGASYANQPVIQTGVCSCRAPFKYEIPVGGANATDHFVSRLIDPGNPDNSKLYGRMSYRDTKPEIQVQMPPIASIKPDNTGLPVIKSWIEGLSSDLCPPCASN